MTALQYKIVSVSTQLILYVPPDGLNQNKTCIRQGRDLNGSNQLWEIQNLEKTDKVKIVSVVNRKVLDIPGGSFDNGTFIQQYDNNHNPQQEWKLIEAETQTTRWDWNNPAMSASDALQSLNKPYIIISALTQKALDASDTFFIEQQDRNNNRQQQWRLVPVDVSSLLIPAFHIVDPLATPLGLGEEKE